MTADDPELVMFPAGGGVRAHGNRGEGAAGTVLFLPHGAWRTTERLWSADVAQAAVRRGFRVLEVIPAKRPAPAFPQALNDAATALDRLAGRGPVAVVGEGTGANVAAALAARGGGICAAVLLSGIYDIPELLATPRQPLPIARVREYLGPRFLAHAADPLASPALADLAGAPHTYLACGDRGPWPEQTLAMTKALANANVPVTCSMFAGDERGGAPQAAGQRGIVAAELARAFDWLRCTLEAPPPRIGDPDHPVTVALRG
jgi:monoterpene epsilon-lactone hydrolase